MRGPSAAASVSKRGSAVRALVCTTKWAISTRLRAVEARPRAPTLAREARRREAFSVRPALLVTSLGLAALLAGCPRFQPDFVVRPAPYRAQSDFAFAPEVALRPELARPDSSPPPAPQYQTDPAELAATPELLQRCLRGRAPTSLQGFRVVPAGSNGAFTLSLAVLSARPGFARINRVSSVGAEVPGASAGASVSTAETHGSGFAEAMLEVRTPSGLPVDRVRLYAQRFPGYDEPLPQRAGALCEGILTEVGEYLRWRLQP